MSTPTDFADLGTAQAFDEANFQNYLAWKDQHTKRRRQSVTLFNVFQYHNVQRMCQQARYKDEAQRESDALKDVIERRISNACDCPTCEANMASSPPSSPKTRRNSDMSTLSGDSTSTTNSARGSDSSLSKVSSAASPSRAVPSSRNSLIASPPPRSRHHHRRAQSIPH